jgi:hypothetical protein
MLPQPKRQAMSEEWVSSRIFAPEHYFEGHDLYCDSTPETIGNKLWTANCCAKFKAIPTVTKTPIVTSDATEALLGQKLSNGKTVDGYRGIAGAQIGPVVSEQTISQVSWGPDSGAQGTSERPRITSTESTTAILEDWSLCAIKREGMCYICCV